MVLMTRLQKRMRLLIQNFYNIIKELDKTAMSLKNDFEIGLDDDGTIIIR